ncbi:glycoside hydrolase family 36 protein [Cohnella yongneupensis]|uniref:Glycoside hydrolase family 36 protein n=1 Tax=Cohnella yongneupensis TaxID=425006 RepID=A0ABW0QXM1_9BACL
MRSIKTKCHEIRLEGESEAFKIAFEHSEAEEGIDIVRLTMTADRPAVPPVMKLSWTMPIVDIHAFWYPGVDRNKALHVDWGSGYRTNATSNAPIGCFYNPRGRNRLTFAFSDALNPIGINAGVHEEDATLRCSLTLFDEQAPRRTTYEAELRIDRRDIPYYESVDQVRSWWERMPAYAPMPVPDAAKRPMYSTWYSFHQDLTDAGVEAQCKLAQEAGYGAVIVDDGWQTSNNERGYAYCGDWEVCNEKIADMRKHVDRIHDLGMKYLLWYSVPFVGLKSNAWTRFADKLLYRFDELGAGVLDPRFPEVREYLIGLYEKAVTEWGVDGFKLDFVDSFTVPAGTSIAYGDGRDYDSVPKAVDRLMTDISLRLSADRPEMMIEFRQTYIGPLMRKYGNLFRAGDCPNDYIQNRVKTLDVRLLAGNTAVHSDMIMWHPSETATSAALQIINVLFSVPQISVRFDRIPPEHDEMLRFWLSFWAEHRRTLLDGTLKPYSPDQLYPLVTAETEEEKIAVVYGGGRIVDEAACGGTVQSRLILVNATGEDRLIVDMPRGDERGWRITVKSCMGAVCGEPRAEKAQGLIAVPVPPSGMAIMERIN